MPRPWRPFARRPDQPGAQRCVALAALLALAGLADRGSPARAAAISDSWTTVSVQASGSTPEGWSTQVRLPMSQHATATASHSTTWPDQTISAFSATGSADALWGDVSASARTTTQGRFMNAWAGGGAEFTGYFQFAVLQPPPFQPAQIPIDFLVNGSGSISGSGTFIGSPFTGYGSVAVYAILKDAYGTILSSQSIRHESAGHFAGAFGPPPQPMVLNAAGPYFSVYLAATASAFSSSALPSDATTSQVDVDSRATIAFDQAAFDARYGSAAFPLASYYAISFTADFSGRPIPAPAPAGLLALALATLATILSRPVRPDPREPR